VLRASSTILTALHHGARGVVPVADMAEASKIASNLDASSFLLGGERGADRIEGYHLGNSPLEFTEKQVKGRTIILNTTNGTRAIALSRAARHLVVGAFLNAGRVVDFIRRTGADTTIVCAGRTNHVSLEDTLCAGLLLHRLWDGQEPEQVSDTAHIAFTQYHHDEADLPSAIRRCNHARWLVAKGYGADVEYCLQIDTLPALPYFKENRLVLNDAVKLPVASPAHPA
jgi:2-phosphosulfolactate phosphatase